MKVSDLLNEAAQGEPGQKKALKSGAYYRPSFRTYDAPAGMGNIRGSTLDWLEGMNVTKADIAKAYEQVKKTPEYKAILALGMKDESGVREQNNGTLNFIGTAENWNSYAKKSYTSRIRYKVLATGKIDVVAENDRNRYDLPVPKPRVVVGDPVATVVKTMTASLVRLEKILKKRVAKK